MRGDDAQQERIENAQVDRRGARAFGGHDRQTDGQQQRARASHPQRERERENEIPAKLDRQRPERLVDVFVAAIEEEEFAEQPGRIEMMHAAGKWHAVRRRDPHEGREDRDRRDVRRKDAQAALERVPGDVEARPAVGLHALERG